MSGLLEMHPPVNYVKIGMCVCVLCLDLYVLYVCYLSSHHHPPSTTTGRWCVQNVIFAVEIIALIVNY